jgi:diguanylate cyclase (GGDEF)-like protein/PAS domain S-box-containing protein
LGVALLYFLTGRLGLLFPYAGTSVTLIWPPTGIAFAAVWHYGRPAVFGVMLGTLLINLTTVGTLGFGIPVMLGNTLPALAARWTLRRLGISDPFHDPSTVSRFVFCAALAGPTLSATVGSLTLWANGMQPVDMLPSTWLTWWAGDAMGVLIVAPVLLSFGELRGVAVSGCLLAELLSLGLAVGLLCRGFFGSSAGPEVAPLSFAAVLIIIWAALRFRFAVVCLVLAALSATTVYATASGHGPFALADFQESFAYLLLFLAALACVALILGTSVRGYHRSIRNAREAAEKLAVTLQSIGDGLLSTDLEGRITTMNAAAESLTGWPLAEARGQPIETVFRIEDSETAEPQGNTVIRVLATGLAQDGTVNPVVLAARDGARRAIAHSAAPVRDCEDRLTGAVMVFRDVSRECRLNARLRDSEARYRAIFEAANDLLGLLAPDGTLIEANPRALTTIGLPLDAVAGIRFSNTPWWNHDAALRSRLRNAITAAAGGATVNFEATHRTPEGSLIFVDLTLSPIRDDQGKVIYLVSHGRDITEAKRTVQTLRASEARFRQLFVRSKAAQLLIDPRDGRIIDANDAAARYYGWPPDTLRTLHLRDINTLTPAEVKAELRRAATERRDHCFFRHRLASGEVRDVEVYSGPLSIDGRQLLYSIVHDVTDRKRAEAALCHREAILETLAFATERLLGSTDWTRDIDEVLARLGHTVDVSRVYVFENQGHGDDIRTSQRSEWTAPDTEPRIGNPALQNLPAREAGFGRWLDALLRGGVIAGDVRDFPETERRPLASQNILSVAVVPVFARQHWWGLIGFDECRRNRQWSAVEIDTLKAVANNLGTAIERQQAEASLRLAVTAFETSEGIMVTDREGTILRINQAFSAITGYTPEDAVGKTPRVLKSGVQDEDFYREMWARLHGEGHWEGEIWNRHKNGEVFPEWLSIRPVRDPGGETTHFVATILDISERKRAESEILHLAYYDPLTGLPNRRLLLDRLQHAFSTARREKICGALMFVDLDHFKHLNDALGHAFGDLLLQQVAERMRSLVREADSIGRLGGDEFVVLLENLSTHPEHAASDAGHMAERIVDAMNRPFALGSSEHHITVSIGIAIFPGEAETAEDLLKQADTSMYRAKAEGRNTVRFFESTMQAAAEIRLEVEKALHLALSRNEFEIHLQPQVDASGTLFGAEALVRWNRPGHGLVSPATFIPVAEDSGLITPIGLWVLEAACRFIRRQQDSDHPGSIAVNISPRQFRRADFVDQIRTVLGRTHADPARLVLELTESAIIDDTEDAIRKMHTLKAIGIHFSIDDFGTGYSSLAYLKQLPVSEIKIDRSFINDVISDPNDAAIVEAILAIADRLQLRVVAEGVETEEQVRFLRERSCQLLQGYYFSRPLPEADYFALLGERSGIREKGARASDIASPSRLPIR